MRWWDVIKWGSLSTEVIGREKIGSIARLTVYVLFSDYDLRGKLHPIWSYITNFLVLTKVASKPPPSWNHTKKHLNHVKCGGVTNGKCCVHVYSAMKELLV